MSYFNKFPALKYPVDTYLSAVKDITLRTRFNDQIINDTLFYDLYRVKDTDTPELIAYAMYGSPFYHWVILMANNVIDPYLDWPMPDSIFNEWVEDKYKHLDTTNIQGEISPGADKTKYWITDSGIVVNQTDPLAVFPISHRLYEDLLNNQKRMIKIVKPDMLYDVVKQFETLITR